MAWAFIAHKDGYWAGVCTAQMAKRDLRKFLGDFAAEGFSIMSVNDRDEYNKALSELKFWHESPEWKMKHEKPLSRKAS
jgi:hypothetical protein